MRYFDSFTGRRFDDFAHRSSPNHFTAWDVVAVSTLSVQIPSNAAIRLIDDEIADAEGELGVLLSRIPEDAAVWDKVDYLAGDVARQLWSLIRGLPELGRTKTSKLLAAKRPFLFPIYDRYVGNALLANQETDDWPLWRERFAGVSGQELIRSCDSVRREAGLPDGISALRILDVSIWMMETSPTTTLPV